MSLNKVTTAPSQYATTVGEEKNRSWQTSGHHRRPMVEATARGGCETAAFSSSLGFVAVVAQVSS